MTTQTETPLRPRLPDWLKVPMPGGPRYIELKQLMRDSQLHTVCEEAHCPNIGECWERSAATFMILGDICTRACAYCAVTTGRPGTLDLGEPLPPGVHGQAHGPEVLRHHLGQPGRPARRRGRASSPPASSRSAPPCLIAAWRC